MFHGILDMPLDYLSCFVKWNTVGYSQKSDICKTNYTICSKLSISHYSEVIHGGTTFKLTSLTKVKEKWSTIQFDVFDFPII